MFGLFAKRYHYVGPEDILSLVSPQSKGALIRSAADVIDWIEKSRQDLSGGEVIATFVIAKNGRLYVADRHSEHVVCAQGEAVLSAGEMTFSLDKGSVEVTEVTNQSTGYCPEARSWKQVAKVLKNAKIPAPDGFTTAFEFRRCEQCGNINLVKDQWYVCAMCDAQLVQSWNIS